MKRLIAILITAALFTSCAPKYGCPKPREYAVKAINGNEVKLVRFEKGLRVKQIVIYECLPQGLKVGDTVSL